MMKLFRKNKYRRIKIISRHYKKRRYTSKSNCTKWLTAMSKTSIQHDNNELNVPRKQIATGDLAIGMHVQELDRPWLETPFLFQGFTLGNQEEIETLQELCDYVYITQDTDNGTSGIQWESPASHKSDHTDLAKVLNLPRRITYHDEAPVEEELEPARAIYRECHHTVEVLFDAVRDGRSIEAATVKETVSGVVSSVLRNPDAFMLLRMMKSKETYSYAHAIDSCALASSFCRHLGFPKNELQDIAFGALILDVGILKIPDDILNTKGRLPTDAFLIVREHVNHGIEILKQSEGIPPTSIEMVATHHERINGKGYPNGLKGSQIPVSGRIAAIVDCYDAMTSKRPYKNPKSPHEAINELYKWRNIDFQDELVEQFIQCLGIYPTGTLVEMNTGQIGIILSQNRLRRLFPKVLLIHNADNIPYEKPHTLDLWDYSQKNKGHPLEIKRALEPSQVGIDPSDYYL